MIPISRRAITSVLLLGGIELCLAGGFQVTIAQESNVEIRGDRRLLDQVLSAHNSLRERMQSYRLRGTWTFKRNVDESDCETTAEIVHRDDEYWIEGVLRLNHEPKRPFAVFQAKDFCEHVDPRKGIVKIQHRRDEEPADGTWQSLTGFIVLTPDIECIFATQGNRIHDFIDPVEMGGTIRILELKKDDRGNIEILRHYSKRQLRGYAEASNGYLLSSIEEVGDPDPIFGKFSTTFEWQNIEGVGLIPKSRKNTIQSVSASQTFAWKIDSYSNQVGDAKLERPSLNPPVGWKIIDEDTKSFTVVGGSEGERIRGILDSVDGVEVREPKASGKK